MHGPPFGPPFTRVNVSFASLTFMTTYPVPVNPSASLETGDLDDSFSGSSASYKPYGTPAVGLLTGAGDGGAGA